VATGVLEAVYLARVIAGIYLQLFNIAFSFGEEEKAKLDIKPPPIRLLGRLPHEVLFVIADRAFVIIPFKCTIAVRLVDQPNSCLWSCTHTLREGKWRLCLGPNEFLFKCSTSTCNTTRQLPRHGGRSEERRLDAIRSSSNLSITPEYRTSISNPEPPHPRYPKYPFLRKDESTV